MSAACWVEMTTVSTRRGMRWPEGSWRYSIVTWVSIKRGVSIGRREVGGILESGRSQPIEPLRRQIAISLFNLWAKRIVMGSNSGVSSVAYPNIIPCTINNGSPIDIETHQKKRIDMGE